LQLTAVAALGRGGDPKAAESLIGGWKRYSPALREAVLDALLSREAWTAGLLSSLEDKCTPLADIGPAHRRRLLALKNQALKGRAEALFSQPSAARQTVLDAYKPALALRGNSAAGAAVFKRVCATCHKMGNEGIEVGPDLATLTDRSPEALLAAILDPNRAFEAKYALFNVALKDGRVLNGMIASETSVSLTLRRQEGKEDVLFRIDIDELAASGQSLMPEGLEKDLKPQELADLLSFLGATR
jgi:putative heme-binding domain-containing protein